MKRERKKGFEGNIFKKAITESLNKKQKKSIV